MIIISMQCIDNMAGFFTQLSKGNVGGALDTLGNGAIKGITKTGSAVQKGMSKPFDIIGDIAGSPMFMPMVIVGGVVVLMILRK